MSILDMLIQIVQAQKDFQKSLGFVVPIKTKDIFSQGNIQSLTYQILSLFDETSEALHCLPWKPWKKEQTFLLEVFWEELMDIFHFLINCCLFSGMTADMIFMKFMEKNRINRMRQENGY